MKAEAQKKTAKARASNKKSNGRSPRGKAAASQSGADAKATQSPEAVDILSRQHREVETLFSQFESAESSNESFEAAQLICQKLTVHAAIEEEIFYPAAEQGESEDLVAEAREEHLSVKRIVADIQDLEPGDETLEAKIKVLKEQVSHHVEEEEDELFPKTQKAMSKEERQTLGQKLVERTEELEAAGEEGMPAEEVAADSADEVADADDEVAADAAGNDDDDASDAASDDASDADSAGAARMQRNPAATRPRAHHASRT